MFPITTGRPATIAPTGMVASPHSLASAAGIDALRAGGSAVDAAIAAGAALSVLYPHMTGVGGDAFWLIYDAEARRVRTLNGGGCAAKDASIDWFRSRGMDEIPLRGFLLRARRLSRHRAARARDRAARRRQRAERPRSRGLHTRRRNAARGRQARQPRARAGAGADRSRRTRGLLRRRDGARARKLLPRGRRIFRRGGLSRAECKLGRAALGGLPRDRDLRDASADPGFYGAGDAQPRRVLRDRQDGSARSRTRAPAGAGETDRLPRQ